MRHTLYTARTRLARCVEDDFASRKLAAMCLVTGSTTGAWLLLQLVV